MKKYKGYVYQWTDTLYNMHYIGSHYGTVEDSYTGSNIRFRRAHKKRPHDFSMCVLEYMQDGCPKTLLEREQVWLNTVDNIKDHPDYFNKKNEAAGGWSFIDQAHIDKRSTTLKKRHALYGLSAKEIRSYGQKIKTRKGRWEDAGFSKKEQEQHSKYGISVLVICPDGTKSTFSSIGKASKKIGIDIAYALIVTKNNKKYKGHSAYKIADPVIDCRKNRHELI